MSTLTAMPLPQLQLLLLDLIAPARSVTQAQLDALRATDWQALMAMVRQQRLAPLLHWQLERAHAHLIIPPDLKSNLAASYKNATLRSLMLQREIVLLHRILKKENIPYVALKGSYLAFHAYPQAALRPLRDVDILVPKDRALEAYQLLIDGGLTRIDHYRGNPEATMSLSNHLPPLRSASGQINVELHSRLFDYEKDGLAQPDPTDTVAFWDRCIQMPLANQAIMFQSPTDLLLHLIEHAVYHHKFDNGPLLLSDLAYLINTQPIDWSLFWAMAKTGRQTRGSLLALKLTQRYWGVEGITWSPGDEHHGALMDEPITAAALLMLRDLSNKNDLSLHNEIGKAEGSAAKFRVLLGKVFPPKANIAANYPVSPDHWRVYLWYPVKWHHQLTNRLFGFLRLERRQHLWPEIKQLADLERWLAV